VASAFERGFFVVVPQDCIAASNADAARITLDSFRNFYGEVVDSADVIDGWRGPRATREGTQTAST
jgi:nicotinamidase-related amidase